MKKAKKQESKKKRSVAETIRNKIIQKIRPHKNQKEDIEITIKRRVTGEVPEEYHFVLKDGRKLASLNDLIESLDEMSDEIFYFHANQAKNDFSNWIRDVLKEDLLAEEVKLAKDRMEAQLKLLKHMVKTTLE